MADPNYTIPGVYFESARTQLEPSLRGVPVGVAGFVGYAAVREDARSFLEGPSTSTRWPVRVESLEQAEELLDIPAWSNLRPALRGYFDNGGHHAYLVGVPEDEIHSVQNVLGVQEPGNRTGLFALDATEEVELILTPDLYVVPEGCEPPEVDHLIDVQGAVLDFCRGERLNERLGLGGYFAILDAPPELDREDVLSYVSLLQEHPNAAFGCFFYPWVEVLDNQGEPMRVPPGGHVAGVLSRLSVGPPGSPPGTITYSTGPHMSPGNQSLLGVVGAEVEIKRLGSRNLLEANINCLLPWSGRGLVVWGTRTLSPEIEQNQISVRRVLSFIERSVYQGTQWAVFEPNDEGLWKQLRSRIENFLEDLWKKGVLVGDSPSEAFYVKCDEENNPPSDRDEGRINVTLMVKPVRSTEFIVLQIAHDGSMGGSGGGQQEG